MKELLLPSSCQEVAETLLPTGFRQNSAKWQSLCSTLWCNFSWTSLLSYTFLVSAGELKKDFAVPIVCLPPSYWVSVAQFALSHEPGPHSWHLTDWHMAVRWGGKHYCTKLVTALSWQQWRLVLRTSATGRQPFPRESVISVISGWHYVASHDQEIANSTRDGVSGRWSPW